MKCRVQFEDSRLLLARRRSLLDSPLEEAGCGLFVPLGISASPSWCSRARKPHGAPEGEFLRGGTNSSNPSPSSGESTNLGPGGAPVPVRHLDPWGFPLVPATLIGRLAIDDPIMGKGGAIFYFLILSIAARVAKSRPLPSLSMRSPMRPVISICIQLSAVDGFAVSGCSGE